MFEILRIVSEGTVYEIVNELIKSFMVVRRIYNV